MKYDPWADALWVDAVVGYRHATTFQSCLNPPPALPASDDDDDDHHHPVVMKDDDDLLKDPGYTSAWMETVAWHLQLRVPPPRRRPRLPPPCNLPSSCASAPPPSTLVRLGAPKVAAVAVPLPPVLATTYAEAVAPA